MTRYGIRDVFVMQPRYGEGNLYILVLAHVEDRKKSRWLEMANVTCWLFRLETPQQVSREKW